MHLGLNRKWLPELQLLLSMRETLNVKVPGLYSNGIDYDKVNITNSDDVDGGSITELLQSLKVVVVIVSFFIADWLHSIFANVSLHLRRLGGKSEVGNIAAELNAPAAAASEKDCMDIPVKYHQNEIQ